jgi:GTP-binding protein LepA
MGLTLQPRDEVRAGDIGYIISGIKKATEVKVGDTITHLENPCTEAVKGFEEVKPMVFAGVSPVDTDDYEDLRASMEKLQLNDASLVFEPESSQALGFGFRCGFLGMLHMEIIQERLEREFNMTVITTVPNVSYYAYTSKGQKLEIHNPSELPDSNKLDSVEEPYIKAQIITKGDFVGAVMTLCIEKRGIIVGQTYLTSDRVELTFEMPLAEIVFDFYDRLKTISKGYASFDYHPIGYQQSDLVKMDILLNGDQVDALSALIHRDHAFDLGKKICVKLKELIPRQQFEIALQAAIGAKIIARETISALRKDVTAKCYGGDISRKRKLLEKQKEGKKRMRQVGSVEVPGVETTVEMGGKQLTMVRKQLQMGKQQVRRAHPCQSSSNSRTWTYGRQLWAVAHGWTWTRRGRSRFSKQCATVSPRSVCCTYTRTSTAKRFARGTSSIARTRQP